MPSRVTLKTTKTHLTALQVYIYQWVHEHRQKNPAATDYVHTMNKLMHAHTCTHTPTPNVHNEHVFITSTSEGSHNYRISILR